MLASHRLLLPLLCAPSLADYYGPGPKRLQEQIRRSMEAVEADKTFYSVWHTKERAHRQAASKESLPTWYSSETFNPFADNNTNAFFFRSESECDQDEQGCLHNVWEDRARAAIENPIDTKELSAAGVTWNSLAVAFKPGFDYGQPIMGEVRRMLLSDDRETQNLGMEAVLSSDHVGAKERPPLPAAHAPHQKQLDALRTDGYFKIDSSWGLAQRLPKPTRDVIHARLGGGDFSRIRKQQIGRGDWTDPDEPIPGLDDLTSHLVPTIRAIATSYLGEDTDYNGGYVALRLPANHMDWGKYISGLWHHDGCSNRVKCFVFLTPVTPDSHPTLVAKGSQRNVYYSFGMGMGESRYDDAYVRANYEAVPMLGEIGEGFCFDTNTVHKGELVGWHGRDALIFEFNAFEKSQVLDRVVCSPCGGFWSQDAHAPCYEGDGWVDEPLEFPPPPSPAPPARKK